MKPFLHGKRALPVPPLRPPASVPAFTEQPPLRPPVCVTTPGASSATVEVLKEGDKVVRLVVTCVCGERVEIECLYAAGS